jgi:hypothetical protein
MADKKTASTSTSTYSLATKTGTGGYHFSIGGFLRSGDEDKSALLIAGTSDWRIGGGGFNGALEKAIAKGDDGKKELTTLNATLSDALGNGATTGSVTPLTTKNKGKDDGKDKNLLYTASPQLSHFPKEDDAKKAMSDFGAKLRGQLNEQGIADVKMPAFSSEIYAGTHKDKQLMIAKSMLEGFMAEDKKLSASGSYTPLNVQFLDPILQCAYASIVHDQNIAAASAADKTGITEQEDAKLIAAIGEAYKDGDKKQGHAATKEAFSGHSEDRKVEALKQVAEVAIKDALHKSLEKTIKVDARRAKAFGDLREMMYRTKEAVEDVDLEFGDEEDDGLLSLDGETGESSDDEPTIEATDADIKPLAKKEESKPEGKKLELDKDKSNVDKVTAFLNNKDNKDLRGKDTAFGIFANLLEESLKQKEPNEKLIGAIFDKFSFLGNEEREKDIAGLQAEQKDISDALEFFKGKEADGLFGTDEKFKAGFQKLAADNLSDLEKDFKKNSEEETKKAGEQIKSVAKDLDIDPKKAAFITVSGAITLAFAVVCPPVGIFLAIMSVVGYKGIFGEEDEKKIEEEVEKRLVKAQKKSLASEGLSDSDFETMFNNARLNDSTATPSEKVKEPEATHAETGVKVESTKDGSPKEAVAERADGRDPKSLGLE